MSELPTRHWDDTVHPPADLTPIGSVRYRERAAVRGTVAAARDTRWTGGPVLEVDIEDPTGSLMVAFFGRHHIAGVEPGHRVTVEGVPVRRHGHPVLMNPLLWVEP
ncbi:MAG TPA: hypothetical protein VH479_03795 [Acidimicrobiales bacterium]|jgi:hypothetical protein